MEDKYGSVKVSGFRILVFLRPSITETPLPTQLSHTLQCDALGGRNILQVKQYFNFTGVPLITMSIVRGGGR